MGPAVILGAAAIVGGGALLGGLLGRKRETTNNFFVNGNQPRSPEQRSVDRGQNGRISKLEQEIQALRQELSALKGGCPGQPCTSGTSSAALAISGSGGGAVAASFFRN